IEFSKYFRGLNRDLASLPTLSIGVHWPSTLSEDHFALQNYFQALSFYTMAKRADTVGENAVYTILRLILGARPAGASPLRIHLLGHSFGCKVVCKALQRLAGEGTPAGGAVFDVVLLQAAFDHDELEPGKDYGNVLASIPGLRLLITRSDRDRALM